MSLIKPILNAWLKLTERPHMARAQPEKLRSSFETKARLFFHAPRGFSPKSDALTDAQDALWIAKDQAKAPVLLYFHGGAYVFGSPRTHGAMLAKLAKLSGARACLPSYRLAPQHPFPAAFDDGLAAYQALLDQGISSTDIFLGGDSAGGGLALAVLGEVLKRGLPKPAGVFAFSPLTDMTYTSTSITENATKDVVLPAERASETSQMYLNGADPRSPKASPLYANFAGACPIFLCVGDTEILRDDTLRLAAKLQEQGVSVTLHVEPNLPHVWPIFHNLLPEANTTLRQVSDWIRQVLSAASGS